MTTGLMSKYLNKSILLEFAFQQEWVEHLCYAIKYISHGLTQNIHLMRDVRHYAKFKR